MRPALVVAAVLTASATAAPLSAQRADEALRARVEARIAAVPGAEVAVAYRELSPNGGALSIAGDTVFHAASTMKVPVLIELHRQAERGGVSLDQPLLLVNRFGSIVDGSPYSLSMADDSDSLLYARTGQRVPVRELAERMIVRSSNLATNALIALLGPTRVTATAQALGATHTRVLRGVEDGKAYERGLNNVTTANDLAVLMAALAEDRAASPAACAAMRETLGRQEFNEEIPAGLPVGTRVAHKTGQITATLHDAAIVYPPTGRPYVLVVLTRAIPDEAVARALIADVSRLVWEARQRALTRSDAPA